MTFVTYVNVFLDRDSFAISCDI